MFSGVYPSTHGYLDGGMPYDPPHPTLAERLREEGYATFGVGTNAKIGGGTDVSRGFEHYGGLERLPFTPNTFADLKKYYLDLMPGYLRMLRQVPGGGRKYAEHLVVEYLTRNIRRYAGRQPFFGFANLNPPHSKYTAPAEYRKRFVRDHPDADLDLVDSLCHKGGYAFMAGEVQPTAADWAAVRDEYDAEIAFADALVGEILATLRRAGVYDETMIIVTADHGEHFGEHGRAYHQFSLFDELLHVPLIIKRPRSEERHRHDELVSLVDLYPTVLAGLGLSVPETVAGRDVFAPGRREAVFAEYGDPVTAIKSLENNSERTVPRDVLAELDRPLRCVRTRDRKLVRSPDRDDLYEFTGGTPKESPLTDAGAEAELSGLLDETLHGDLAVEAQTPDDPAVRKNLEDLGYL
jgi:arylsulfatase A-like enzyme